MNTRGLRRRQWLGRSSRFPRQKVTDLRQQYKLTVDLPVPTYDLSDQEDHDNRDQQDDRQAEQPTKERYRTPTPFNVRRSKQCDQ